jgi:hypothetical protein
MKFDDYLTEQMQNPEFKKEWDALEPWYQAEKAKIEARIAREARRRKSKTVAEKVPVRRAF